MTANLKRQDRCEFPKDLILPNPSRAEHTTQRKTHFTARKSPAVNVYSFFLRDHSRERDANFFQVLTFSTDPHSRADLAAVARKEERTPRCIDQNELPENLIKTRGRVQRAIQRAGVYFALCCFHDFRLGCRLLLFFCTVLALPRGCFGTVRHARPLPRPVAPLPRSSFGTFVALLGLRVRLHLSSKSSEIHWNQRTVLRQSCGEARTGHDGRCLSSNALFFCHDSV